MKAAMPALSAKPVGIFPHACVSTMLVIRTVTSSDLYKILSNAALFVLMIISAS